MAKVIKRSTGYEFVGMSAAGMRLVNEFQTQHPLPCLPSPVPDYRFIRLGSQEQKLKLEKLATDVISRDPDKILSPPTFKTRK